VLRRADNRQSADMSSKHGCTRASLCAAWSMLAMHLSGCRVQKIAARSRGTWAVGPSWSGWKGEPEKADQDATCARRACRRSSANTDNTFSGHLNLGVLLLQASRARQPNGDGEPCEGAHTPCASLSAKKFGVQHVPKINEKLGCEIR
jgi:hypothetical protein